MKQVMFEATCVGNYLALNSAMTAPVVDTYCTREKHIKTVNVGPDPRPDHPARLDTMVAHTSEVYAHEVRRTEQTRLAKRHIQPPARCNNVAWLP